MAVTGRHTTRLEEEGSTRTTSHAKESGVHPATEEHASVSSTRHSGTRDPKFPRNSTFGWLLNKVRHSSPEFQEEHAADQKVVLQTGSRQRVFDAP
jgi:hypothetical protein